MRSGGRFSRREKKTTRLDSMQPHDWTFAEHVSVENVKLLVTVLWARFCKLQLGVLLYSQTSLSL